MGNIRAALRRLGKQVWLRAGIFTLVSIVLALAAGFVGALIPYRLVIDLGQNSVGSVLQIIASSMLTVTTFSLTTMVTAYSSSTTNGTPRATQLLVDDPTSQNALSTFIGGFTFSLVGIIALSTGYYTDQGRTILFAGTLVMIALIVITLLRWIAHLSSFGRVGDTIDRVERAAALVLDSYSDSPTLGARAFDDHASTAAASTGAAIHPESTGYVTFIDLPALERAAARVDAEIFVMVMPGSVADPTTPLVHVTVADDQLEKAVRRSFRLANHRSFEQDPRLGVIALSEIGSRALSPATNDPGTAIEVLAALQRVLGTALSKTPTGTVTYPHLRVRPTSLDDLVIDAFRPLARDGAALVEVQIRLQKCLAALARTAPASSRLFRSAADGAVERAREALPSADFDALEQACSDLNWKHPTRGE